MSQLTLFTDPAPTQPAPPPARHPGMHLWISLLPLPSGQVRLRVYRLTTRLYLTHDVTGPLDQVLAELGEIARPSQQWIEPE